MSSPCVHHDGGSAPRVRRAGGFTVTELIVATVVMSIALLGIQTVFTRLMGLQADKITAWNDNAQATVVADYLAQIIERATPASGYPSITATGQELRCMSALAPAAADPVAPGTTAMYRLRWGLEDEQAGMLGQKWVLFSGDQIISPHVEGFEPDEPQFWEPIPEQWIARRLSGITMRFRHVADTDDPRWFTRWSGNPGDVEVRIEVRLGSERIERRVFPQIVGASG